MHFKNQNQLIVYNYFFSIVQLYSDIVLAFVDCNRIIMWLVDYYDKIKWVLLSSELPE